MALEGEMPVEGPWVDRLCGLEGVQVDITMMRTPDGHGRVELTKFRNPELVGAEPAIAPPNTLGLRQIMFAVEDIDDTVARLRADGAELVGEGSVRGHVQALLHARPLRASSSRWPRNSSDAFNAVRDAGGTLGAPSTRYPVWQPSFFLASVLLLRDHVGPVIESVRTLTPYPTGRLVWGALSQALRARSPSQTTKEGFTQKTAKIRF
jgi:catechol 2,3-dioxygenase-like lactoylglutathione lyase family enzyme